MKVGGGWMWCLLLLSSLTVAAHEREPELDVSDDDLGLDEEELKVLMAEDGDEEEEEATVMDEEPADETDEMTTDSNVTFQVTYKTPVPTGDVYFAENIRRSEGNRRRRRGEPQTSCEKEEGKERLRR